MYTWVALSCERLVSRFSISIFQGHVPIQCHYEWVFISRRRSENSPVTRQKSSAKCLVVYPGADLGGGAGGTHPPPLR